MVRLIGPDNFYRQGCTDGTTLILSLVMLCASVALVTVNYLAAWPVFLPAITLCVVIVNMAAFSSDPLVRYKSMTMLILITVFHAAVLICAIVYLALLVSDTPLFLSPDCKACQSDWVNRDDEICGRAMPECRDLGKYRFAIFVLFPLASSILVMELVNLSSGLLAILQLRKEKAVAMSKKDD